MPGKHLAAPEVVRSRGEAPQQIANLDLADPAPKKGAVPADDLMDDSEFYGSESFNSDEFDPEGFEMSDESSYYRD